MEFEPGAGIVERCRVELAHPFPSPRFAGHKARAFEHTQMFRHGGEREGKGPGEMADGRFTLGQAVEDGAAGGVAERVEDEIEVLFNRMVE